MSTFIIDGIDYSASVTQLTRKFQILDGPNAGRVMNGRMHRDVIGTYFPYNATIDASFLTPIEYDDLYETLSAPVDYHKVKFPYGQTTLEFDMYVTAGSDQLLRQYNGINYWGDITLDFVTMNPLRLP